MSFIAQEGLGSRLYRIWPRLRAGLGTPVATLRVPLMALAVKARILRLLGKQCSFFLVRRCALPETGIGEQLLLEQI